MKKYESPMILAVQFRMEDVLSYSTGDFDDELETPIIPFSLTPVDLGL